MTKLWVFAAVAFLNTVSEAQEANLATLTVSDIQQMYKDGGRSTATQDLLQVFFNGHIIGFTAGVSAALQQADIVTSDVSPAFPACIPMADRIFYALLAASGAKSELNLYQFTSQHVWESCQDTIDQIIRKQK